MLVTDLADYLVKKGVAFRGTYYISGQRVAYWEKTDIPTDKLKLADFQRFDSRFGEDILEVFDYEHSVEIHSAPGGTSKASVQAVVKERKGIVAINHKRRAGNCWRSKTR